MTRIRAGLLTWAILTALIGALAVAVAQGVEIAPVTAIVLLLATVGLMLLVSALLPKTPAADPTRVSVGDAR